MKESMRSWHVRHITQEIIYQCYMPVAPSYCNPGGEEFGDQFTYDDICRQYKNWTGWHDKLGQDFPLSRAEFGKELADMIYNIRGTAWLENRQCWTAPNRGVRYYRIHRQWWYGDV